MGKKEKLEEFTELMEKILDEKTEKYKGKISTIATLRENMHKQAKGISTIISSRIGWDHEEVKRKLVHVANFAYLIYNML